MRLYRYIAVIMVTLIATHRMACAQLPAGYDVILLVGQSNMVGYGTGPDNASDAAVSPRLWQLAANGTIIPAQDPLVQAQSPGYVGMAMTFGKAYLKTLPANRNVLFVGAAYGNTGFATGQWQAPSGVLATNAVTRANQAMTAAGAGARFAGILWHQGEYDVIAGDAAAYQSNLATLINYFRTNITGAGSTTPFVVGEITYPWIVDNLVANSTSAYEQYFILQDFHALPDVIPYTAWVSSNGLAGDVEFADIHFSALSQRQLGRRYADKFFEAANNLPQPEMSMKSWNGAFIDDGRSFSGGVYGPVDRGSGVSGTVTAVTDPVRGNVAQISQSAGSITYAVPGTTFNGSYTKMVWFQPGAPGYYNNLISANNAGQSHFLAAVSSPGAVTIVAGQSAATLPPVAVAATVPATSGVWMNIALVYDATRQSMALYVNGTLVKIQGGVAPAPAAPQSIEPVVMGGYGTVAGTGIDGEMAGNRVWTAALSATQIQAIYGYELNSRAGF